MATVTPAAIRKAASGGRLDPVYLIVGDDEAEMAELTSAISSAVEEDLRAFNHRKRPIHVKRLVPPEHIGDEIEHS